MTGKELMRHLHMGCGESLKTVLNVKPAAQKTNQKNLEKQQTPKVEKAFRVN